LGVVFSRWGLATSAATGVAGRVGGFRAPTPAIPTVTTGRTSVAASH
jgi:hypothetical protein